MDEKGNIPNNLEIDKALKEFEEKSQTEQARTDSYKAVKFYSETDAPKIVRWVMKSSGGTIKEQKQAEYVLFGLVVIMFALSFYFFIR